MPELTHEQLNAGRGALVCMPLLVINLGGEMLYILEQRLRAQNISSEKAMKVLGDVASAMYDETFMKELFVPQPIYTKGPTRHIFDRLAHSSVMRLNKTSMDKVSDMLLFTLQCAKSREEVVVLVLQLFDLMTMGVKYQVLATTHPAEIIDVTINHMQSVKEIVNKPAVSKFIDSAAALVDKVRLFVAYEHLVDGTIISSPLLVLADVFGVTDGGIIPNETHTNWILPR